jgi:hypothetical protein
MKVKNENKNEKLAKMGQFRQKWGNEKNLFPVNRKPERAVHAKMRLKNKRERMKII